MKRYVKNIIFVIIILLMCGLTFLTVKAAKNTVTNNTSDIKQNMNGNEPPSMPNNDSSKEESKGNSSENGFVQEPPEKPSGENNNENSSNNNSNEMNNPPSMGNNQNNNMPDMNPKSSSTIDVIYYVIFAIEGLIISSLILYLIMSKFNKKTFKETFSNKDKILIYSLSIIILTTCITTISTKITNSINNKTNTKEMTNNNSSVSYSGKKEITSDTNIESGTYDSSDKDQNSILVSGNNNVNLSNIKVTKTGDSDGGDNTSFYGTNSGILAKDGTTLTLKNITVTTNATEANGVFSYGGSATTNNSSSDGTTVNISDSKITTTKDNSGGIMTTGGGIMNASNLTINTKGISSAAIRTDRGGGKVTVKGGTYTTTGQGSPTIYSTADVSVSNAKLISTASEGIVIEGKNSVTIDNCTLTDTNNKLNGKSTTYKNIFLYQSMSGDAESGTSSFTAKNSTITTNKGDSFYITNTTATINLTNNKIINNDSTGNFLRVKKDSWGNSGSNGGIVTLNMNKQKVKGNIVIDSISTLTMNLKNKSYYEGTINKDNSAKSITLTLDKTSSLKLTGNSYVTKLTNSDSSNSNIDFNGYKLYVNGVAIN